MHTRKRKIPDIKEHAQGHMTQICRQIPVWLLKWYYTAPGSRHFSRKSTQVIPFWRGKTVVNPQNHDISQAGKFRRLSKARPKSSFLLLKKANRQNNSEFGWDGEEIWRKSNFKSLDPNNDKQHLPRPYYVSGVELNVLSIFFILTGTQSLSCRYPHLIREGSGAQERWIMYPKVHS